MRITAVALVATLAAGCGGHERPAASTAPPSAAPARAEVQVVEVPPPAGAGAAQPFLTHTRDGVLLSWLEPVAGTKRVALRISRRTGEQWSAPSTVIERDDLFVNWADFPSVIEDANGVLYTHWLQKSGAGTYSYDVRMSTSTDGGATWRESFLLNRDGREAEHGFVTLAALPSGGIGATWLDGRNMSGDGHSGEGGDMTLRYATVQPDGTIADDVELDARTCECCTTGMTMTSDGPVIVYRDRSPEEIRDISYVKRTAAGWTEPRLVNPDGWKINACPVNGPQIDARGKQVVTGWFTAANEQGRAYVAFSEDGGATFGEPIRIDDGKPIGRVDVLLLDDSSALVTWLEQTPSGGEIRTRRVSQQGPQPAVKVADSSTARAAGFPRVARAGENVFFAWTEQSATTRKVHVARMRI